MTDIPPSIQPFLDHLRCAERSPLTVRSYVSDLAGFSAWFEAANGDVLAPALVTPTDLREFKAHLLQRQLRPSSVNRKLAALKSFLGWAAEAGMIPAAPKMPRQERQGRLGPRWLDRREQNALLRAVERGGSARDIAAVQLMLQCGLRVAELCALVWADVVISDRRGTLTVRSGKGGKRRTVLMNADARAAVIALGHLREVEGADAVFAGQRGPLTVRGVQKTLEKYSHGKSGTDGVSPHDLRHSFCKNLVDAGVGLPEVAALAGHESLETTRRYTEPSLKDLERAVDRLV